MLGFRPPPDYGSGGWGFEPLAARHHHRWSMACDGVAGSRRVVRLRPNCDHVGRQSLGGCDHLRPPWPIRAILLLVSADMEARRSVIGCGRYPPPTSTSGPVQWSARPPSVGGLSQLMISCITACRGSARAERRRLTRRSPSDHGKDGSPVRFGEGLHEQGSRSTRGMGASARR
jgi:hypothetical protein